MAIYPNQIKSMVKEDENLLRTKEEYADQIKKVQTKRGKNEKASKEYGLNRESCLNQLQSFHVLENMPPDLLHDVLEGALSLTVKRLLRYYLYDQLGEKAFTLDWLNERISNFDFDYAEIKDKPSELKEDKIKDEESGAALHQSACQLWQLATILPIILSPLIDTEDEHWENFLDILEICRILFTLQFPRWQVNYLQGLIEKYLASHLKLYGGLIPKQHFLIHYPRWILKLGSLLIYMCLRCEANHKYFKRLISVISAYKNVPLFLARRDQLHQSYLWRKSLRSESTCGPCKTVYLKIAPYGNMISTATGEVIESTWLQLHGIKFVPDRCYIMVDFVDCLPVFALIKHVIVYPAVAFVCQKVKTIRRDVVAACFIVSPTNDLCVHRAEDMQHHSVFHAHYFGGHLAIVSKHSLGGQP